MNGCKRFDRFKFNDDKFLNKQIKAITRFDAMASIHHWKLNLMFHAQASIT